MKVYFLNTMSSGLETISLIQKKHSIDGIIGLSHREKNDLISDYVYQADFCNSHGLDFIEVDGYNLQNKFDREKISDLDIDVLVVSGWQRLIPEWLISHVNKFVVGIHGSPLGITKGRGRSPQNWALILGLKDFYISIFIIDTGIDSGKLIATKKFSLGTYDDIKTSYYKASILVSEMLVDLFSQNEIDEKNFILQNEQDAEYFPQRLPKDGGLDWNRSIEEIRGFVRALTKPYPGARTFINKTEIIIWSLIPFEINYNVDAENGEIVNIFNRKDILVKAKDGFLLINDFTIIDDKVELQEGMKFSSVPYPNQINEIITRHRIKYPKLPISKLIDK